MAFACPPSKVPVRLVTERSALARDRDRSPLYRPLILGPALAVRAPGGGPWEVEVTCDGRLTPQQPRSGTGLFRHVARARAQGFPCRVAAALVTPGDAPEARWEGQAWRPRGRQPLEMYGWALMYQPPGLHGIAIIDPHDRHADLPAWFELPHELLDRIEHLARHGIPSRPLALLTAATDFDRGADGELHNRFTPAARFSAARAFVPW